MYFWSKLNAPLVLDVIIHVDLPVGFPLWCALWTIFSGTNNLVVGEKADLCDNMSNRIIMTGLQQGLNKSLCYINLPLKRKVKGECITCLFFNERESQQKQLSQKNYPVRHGLKGGKKFLCVQISLFIGMSVTLDYSCHSKYPADRCEQKANNINL